MPQGGFISWCMRLPTLLLGPRRQSRAGLSDVLAKRGVISTGNVFRGSPTGERSVIPELFGSRAIRAGTAGKESLWGVIPNIRTA